MRTDDDEEAWRDEHLRRRRELRAAFHRLGLRLRDTPAPLTLAEINQFRAEYGLAPLPAPDELPVIGCDVARVGDDVTAIHVRRGPDVRATTVDDTGAGETGETGAGEEERP